MVAKNLGPEGKKLRFSEIIWSSGSRKSVGKKPDYIWRTIKKEKGKKNISRIKWQILFLSWE